MTPKEWSPQRSLLAPCLFNISDIPTTLSTKLAYADDLALPLRNWANVENAINSDLSTLHTYYHKIGSTLAAKKKQCMPGIILTHMACDEDWTFPCTEQPSRLTQTWHFLQWSLTGQSPPSHILHLCGRFATLNAVTLASVQGVGALREHAQDQKPGSCLTHYWKLLLSMVEKQAYDTVNVAINSALRMITECLKLTPAQYLPALAPAPVRRNAKGPDK